VRWITQGTPQTATFLHIPRTWSRRHRHRTDHYHYMARLVSYKLLREKPTCPVILLQCQNCVCDEVTYVATVLLSNCRMFAQNAHIPNVLPNRQGWGHFIVKRNITIILKKNIKLHHILHTFYMVIICNIMSHHIFSIQNFKLHCYKEEVIILYSIKWIKCYKHLQNMESKW